MARAAVLASGKKQAVCQCEVFAIGDVGDRLVAVAQENLDEEIE